MTERRPLVLVSGEIKELPSGDTLPSASGGWTLISSASPSGVASVEFNDVHLHGYGQFLFRIFDASHNGGTSQNMHMALSDDGSNWGASQTLSASVASSAALGGEVLFPDTASTQIWCVGRANDTTAGNRTSNTGAQGQTCRLDAGLQDIKFLWSSGANFDGSSLIEFYGRA